MKLTRLSILLSICIIFMAVNLDAKENNKSADPFDLSSTQKQVDELGVPTVSEVNSLESKAKELYSSGNYSAALPVLEEYAKKANWLANLISAGLEPYYGASYDDRKDFPYSKASKLIPIEATANDYRKKRNRAMVMQAECLIKTGKKEKAVSLLVRALDLIDIENEEWWDKAKMHLYEIIEMK